MSASPTSVNIPGTVLSEATTTTGVVNEFLCDDIRQLVISFLGNSISSIGLEAGTTNSSTFSIVHASSHDQQHHRHNKFPLLRSSLLDHKKTSHSLRKQPPSPFKNISTCKDVNTCLDVSTCKTFNPFSLQNKTRTTSSRSQQQPFSTSTGRDDDLLTVQLLSHSWNVSFHRTCLEATHIVVRRAIICRHRCLASSGKREKKKKKKTEQTIANEMVEEEEALLYRDVADLATDQKLFLEAHQEEVRQMDAAVTVWKAATASLDVLDKRSFSELKMLARPPQMVMVVMEAVCILFGEKPEWAASKKFLSDSSFLDKLLRFPKDQISPTTLKKLQKYTSDPNFVPNVVRRSSIACEGLCAWVRALETYTQVGHAISTKNKQLKTQIALAQEIITLADMLLTSKARPPVQREELSLPAGLEQNQISPKLTEAADDAAAETSSIRPDFSG